jgi:hypothetical protein
MMNVTYQYWIRQAPEVRQRAEQAARRLDEMLSGSTDPVSAEWDMGEGPQGRSVVTLRLSDFSGSAIAVFEPAELESPSHVEARLRRLWIAMLQVRSDKLVQSLRGADGQGD